MTETPRPAGGRFSGLAVRTASGAVMIAAALLTAWLGGIPFAVFWTLAGVAVGVEWAWLVAADPVARRRTARTVAVTLGVAGAALGLSLFLLLSPVWVALVLLAGAGLAALFARPTWFAALAVPYGAAAFVGVMMLRGDPKDGFLATAWLFAVVWSTDIAAFFAGRAFGGPKLAPSISPKKTWSGATGGAVAAVAVATGVAAAGGVERLWPLAVVAFAASVASQAGDLIESGVKRVYGAKDSSQLIPGHGGLMDRLDGFLVASSLVAALGAARGGFEAAGQGLLRW